MRSGRSRLPASRSSPDRAVQRPDHRGHCPEGGPAGARRHHGPRDARLWGWHSVRTGPIGWGMPVVANLVLRNLIGLSIFIGTVVIGAGSRFVQAVASNGIQILLGGAAVLLTLVLIVLGGGYLLRIPFDDLLGVCAGSASSPAILAAASRLALRIGPTSATPFASRA